MTLDILLQSTHVPLFQRWSAPIAIDVFQNLAPACRRLQGSPGLSGDESRIHPIAPVGIDSIASIRDDKPQLARSFAGRRTRREGDIHIPWGIAGAEERRFCDELVVQINLGDDARPPACSLSGPTRATNLR